MNFSLEEVQSLQLGRQSARYQHTLEDIQMENCSAENDLGILVLKTSQQCALPAKKANDILDCIKQVKIVPPLYSPLMRPHLEH